MYKKIDANGFFIEDTPFYEEGVIDIECPEGFSKPKWDDEKWIEGATQEEIDAINNTAQPLTTEERVAIAEQALNDIIMMMMF